MKKEDQEKKMLEKIKSLEKTIEMVRLENQKYQAEVTPKVRRIDEQYRAESIRIKNFETETAVISANQSRQEERLKQVQSSINGFQKSITKINEKLVSTNSMATIKVNPATTEQTPIPMVNPRYEKPKPKTQPDRDNGTIGIEQCRRSVGNTETSTRQGHPPPRTTGKEVAQPQRTNSNTSVPLADKSNRTDAHCDNKRDSDRGDTQDEEGEDAELDIFEGVTYKRKARYYLAGISPRSTRTGLINYVSRKGIKVTHFILFKAKYTGARLTAKINVPPEDAELLESRGFWPEGVSCRRWMSQRAWKEKIEADNQREDRDHSENGDHE